MFHFFPKQYSALDLYIAVLQSFKVYILLLIFNHPKKMIDKGFLKKNKIPKICFFMLLEVDDLIKRTFVYSRCRLDLEIRGSS